ncbi:uncharacterized protein [Solanum tuberosum]|uniref:uncharacterized protein n=1 Tax=Solanum tuberosum TaxID=4113 RepID=UPI00073A0D40|nr:PREDICTED: uncharacterized protein LOC107060896 [Solanum tuberosum]
MKWLWRYGQTEVGFWKDVIKAKYGIQDHWCPKESNEPHGVGVWKHISSFQDDFFWEVSFKAGNGLKIRFWQDKLLGNSMLKDSFPFLFQIASNKEAIIAQYRDNNFWAPIFRRNFQDWEINDIFSLLETLESTTLVVEDQYRILWGNSKE